MLKFQKQTALKPQDLVVSLKIALAPDSERSYAQLAKALFMSASEAHAAVQRALTSRLLVQNSEGLRANAEALREFLMHGLAYSFPGVEGPVTRGMPTGAAAPHWEETFDQTQGLPWVWPDGESDIRGLSMIPLYPSVPSACRADPKLYRMLSSLDALRAGAAREREIAQREVLRLLA